MIWWWWCVLGLFLLSIELAAVEAEFYLVFAGLAALVTGAVAYFWPGTTDTIEWALFAVLSLVFMVTIRRRVYGRMVDHLPQGIASHIDQMVTIPSLLAPGQSVRVEYRGSQWTARNDGDAPIAAGAEARITSVNGLTLHVRS